MRAAGALCERCGRRASRVDMYGTPLCSGCLGRSVRERVLRWLRKASPHPRDTIVLVSRGDAQSLAALRLVSAVEKNYDVTIHVLEIGKRSTLRGVCDVLQLEYAFVEASYETYTDFRLSMLPHLIERREALVALPDTIEDLAAYALGEVLLGNYRGVKLEAHHRVAYPLGAVSLRELHQLFPGKLPAASPLFEGSRAREIVEWALRSSPTLCNSIVRTLLETIEALTWGKWE